MPKEGNVGIVKVGDVVVVVVVVGGVTAELRLSALARRARSPCSNWPSTGPMVWLSTPPEIALDARARSVAAVLVAPVVYAV